MVRARKRISVTRGGCGCTNRADHSEDALTIRPRDFAPLFGDELGDVFLLVTSPAVRALLSVEADGATELEELSWQGRSSADTLRSRLRELRSAGRTAAVLWLADDEFVHLAPSDLRRAKLGAISYFSGSLSAASLAACLDVVRHTDYQRDLRIESALLEALDNSECVRFRSRVIGTEATFRHADCEHWFSLEGPLGFGQQTVLPTGELSTLTDASGQYSFERRFVLEGELLLRGIPVVHRGAQAVPAGAAEQLFDQLASMQDDGARAIVRDGLIVELQGIEGRQPGAFATCLKSLFEADERYRKVHEIGFGTNPLCTGLRDENFFPNERAPSVHFGLGLGGFTEFHIDLVCPELDVIFEGGEVGDRDIRAIVASS